MFKLTYITLIVAVTFAIAVAAPYQELPPRPGHVPVYIREGNTPLSEVNPILVEAFHEDEPAKNQLESKTPEVVPEVNEDNNQKGAEEDTKLADNKNEINTAKDVKDVDETTASDIAEFDEVKSVEDNVEADKVESISKDNE